MFNLLQPSSFGQYSKVGLLC